LGVALIGPLVFAASTIIGKADGGGIIPSGEYAGQAFTVHLTAEYSEFGLGTLITGAGTSIQIGGERFEAIVSPAFGTFQSLCCGEGHAFADSFSMTGEVRHVTAAVPHNHLFGASSQTYGSMCINIADQSGSIVTPTDPPHDPGVGLICDIAATVTVGNAARTVVADIKPASTENIINPKESVIPVAILSTDDFDATTVDPMTVRFGPDAAAEIHGRGHLSDVNDDGGVDLILHFATAAAGIVAGSDSTSLSGKTFDGVAIEGQDAIVTVPR
jgi:hypothetical protein